MGFAESFAAIEAAWSLQRAGMRVLAFTRSGARPPLHLVPEVELVQVTAPEVDATAWVEDVAAAATRHAADAFLPLDDAALWLTGSASLAPCAVVGPTARGVAVALDKEAQVKLATACGLRVPPTEVVEDLDDLRLDAGPRVVKPAEAVRLVGHRLVRPKGRICADDHELDVARRAGLGGRMLVQPVLAGRGEGLFGSVDRGESAPWSAHRRVRMVNPSGSASSACESAEVDLELQTGTARLLEALSWSGLFMTEFLRDAAGRPWFMELNGRAWGSLALARRRGLEYPAWAVQAALGLPRAPAPPEHPPSLRCRHAGRELAHLGFVLRGSRSAAVVFPGRGATVRDLLTVRRSDRLYNWDPGQPRVLLADTWQTVADHGRRLRGGRG
jgi:hypothetical protein